MPLYRQGTVSLTQGSRQLVGVGTEFGVKTSPGDILVLLQGNQVHHFYEFKSIESDTEATLDIEAHDTVTNSEFVILRSVSTANNLYLMRKIDEFLKDRQITLDEWRDWLQGTTDGGPEGDGRYPMTDRYGVTTLVPSPMALQRDLVESLTDVQDLLEDMQDMAAVVIQATEARDDAVAAAASVLDLELETESYKDAAEAAATAAEGYQSVAEGHATDAATSAADAQGYLNTVADHAQAAAESETNAAASELAASISEANAQASATLASTKADEASGFADDAGTFALDSAASADAAGMSATAASTSEMNSAASASQSHTSAQESATSAGESAASAADALSSQVAAAASASQAQTSAGEASGYADDAAASAAAAATSEANAAASLTLAEAAASEAQTHRNAASTSANDAEAAKNAAQGWAANAAASASGISAYVDDAFSHAQSAQTSAQAAQNYADNAQGYSQEAGQRAQEVQTQRDYAEQSAQNANESEQKAQAWANQMGSPVEDGEYSARHWASQAQAIVGGHATGIGFTPTDTLESTNVQDAIEEAATRSSVSEDPGNTLEQREDGLFVEVPEIDLSEIEAAISNLETQVNDEITTTITTLEDHTTDTDNPHNVTKAQVGLGNVDNTSDLDKPISTATQAVLDTKADTAFVNTEISVLKMDSSPTGDFTAEAGKSYWLNESYVVTLPNSTGLEVGSYVRFAKALQAAPTIQVGAGGAEISTDKGASTSVLFDLNAEITFVFNGTDWEL